MQNIVKAVKKDLLPEIETLVKQAISDALQQFLANLPTANQAATGPVAQIQDQSGVPEKVTEIVRATFSFSNYSTDTNYSPLRLLNQSHLCNGVAEVHSLLHHGVAHHHLLRLLFQSHLCNGVAQTIISLLHQ